MVRAGWQTVALVGGRHAPLVRPMVGGGGACLAVGVNRNVYAPPPLGLTYPPPPRPPTTEMALDQ